VTARRPDAAEILRVLADLERWLERHDWRAWEPHDGLRTPVRKLLGQHREALLAVKQVVLRSPWNVRPLLGIPRGTSPESLGFFAKGYLRLHRATGDERYRAKAVDMLERMLASAEPGYSGLCWGNKFDYITRFFYLPAGTPIIVWTSHNAHALVDAYEQLGDRKHLEAAVSAATFVTDDLPRHVEGDTVCLSYVPIGDHPVHNANVLGASLLARVGAQTGRQDLIDLSRRAMAYTVNHQRPDGSWWYGEASDLRWVDSFHTGYVLESLELYRAATGDRGFDAAMARGFDYFCQTFFTPDAVPRYFSNRTYPIDIQCSAQAIETLLLLGQDASTRELARRVAAWTVDHMRDASGYFYFRRHPRVVNRTPLLHWGQATMFSALAGLLEVSDEQ
jgi:rhamnogalacturonyl hydrolase YesR